MTPGAPEWSDARPPAILTRAECEALGRRVLGLVTAPLARLNIRSVGTVATEFARGEPYVASKDATAEVYLTVHSNDGKTGIAMTNRLDEAGLGRLVREAEAASLAQRSATASGDLLGPQRYPTPPKLFFDAVLPAMAPEARATLFQAAIDTAEAAGLIGAGDVGLELSSRAAMDTAGLFAYTQGTYGEFSLTARTKNGLGSGWAWGGYEDWAKVDVKAVVTRAVDLAQRSAKPVAVEPGRYTVILEPAAVAELVQQILPWWSARWADQGTTVFSKDPEGTNKIGLKMMDERLGIVSDPWDPARPASPVAWGGEPLEKVVWFERGVLRNLEYDPAYANAKHTAPVRDPGGARLSAEGPAQTLEEMIASTKRGVWVNRLSHVTVMNQRTLLLTGTTRDGTFLIENGKITKAIKNFRFTESPFFVLNKVEAVGEPVRAARYAVAPRIKVREFDFTSLTDAV